MTATTPHLSPKPWLRIWIHPRSTVRELLVAPSGLTIWVLAMVSGIGQSLVQGAQNNVGAKAPVLTILSVSALVGAIWGLLQLHVLALLLYLVGRWTSGKATFQQVRAVIAWAEIPHVVLVASWLLGTVFFGRLLFVNTEALGASPPPALLFGMMLVYLTSLVCLSWSFVILVQGLAEAQGMSAWKSLGSILTAGLMLGVVALLVVTIAIGVTR